MDETQVDSRARTFSWSDPALIASHAPGRTGLELLHDMITGELPAPPVLHMLGVDSMEAEEGRVTVLMSAQEFHYNPLGRCTAESWRHSSTPPPDVQFTARSLPASATRRWT